MNSLVGAIDCGTNSTRLLIGDGVRQVERRMRITRLGEGVDATGRLADAAIERVRVVLEEYAAVLAEHEVSRLRMTATSAARDATNRDDFFAVAEQTVGVRPELLSGLEEGQLSFAGATAELDAADGPYLVVDIGGGSTEFAFGAERCEAAVSVDMGCVRMTEKFIESDPPRPEELLACLSVTEATVDEVLRNHPQMQQARQFVGLAGTVSNTAAVEQGLAEYDRAAIHHFRLTKAAVEDVFRTLVTEPLEDRLHNPGLEPERGETIIGGLCILVQIMRTLGFADCLVSEADILDGLVASQL
ncbi:MAG: exopolyphosphatase [Acidimicrobiales bacterium]